MLQSTYSYIYVYNFQVDIYTLLMTQFAILKINRGWDGYCVCDVSSVIIRDHPHNNNNKKIIGMSNTGFKKDFKIWANKKFEGS